MVKEGRGLSHAQQNQAGCAPSHLSLLTRLNFVSSSSDVAIHELGFPAQSSLANFEKLIKNT